MEEEMKELELNQEDFTSQTYNCRCAIHSTNLRGDAMSKWITDRKPTYEDTGENGYVWVWDNKFSMPYIGLYESVEKDNPWQKIAMPEPYVEPKRHFVKEWAPNKFCVVDRQSRTFSDMFLKTREAAQHIADAYNEVMP
jgi:hypothetical protein